MDFGGWDMPLHYGSQIDEHHHVRRNAGMFDVSHMTIVDATGTRVVDFLGWLLANDISKLKQDGKALYSCMLNDNGGVIDDLIIYRLSADHFRMVVNAATRDKDMAWIKAQAAAYNIDITERRDTALISVQGPQARAKVAATLDTSAAEQARALPPFGAAQIGDFFVARTGYTGEDGLEVALPATQAVSWWNRLLAAHVPPCGLGARDTLRLEAGLNLYGHDMDETTSPLEAGLGWTVAWQPTRRDFCGRAALTEQQNSETGARFVGLVLKQRGVLRAGQTVTTPAGDGRVTSGSFSPTLNRAIGLARIPAGEGDSCTVDIRGRQIDAHIVTPPFVRHGQIVIEGL